MSSDAPDPAGRTPDAVGRFSATVRSWGLVRGDDRWFAGVCGAVAARTGTDAAVVRGALAALTLVGGLGLALYGVAWLLLPDSRGRLEAEAVLRGDVSASAAGAVLLVVADLAVSRGVLGFGSGWGNDGRGWSLLVTSSVAALAWWLLRDRFVGCGPRAAATAPAGVDLRKHPAAPDDATRPLPAPVPVAVPAPPVTPPPTPSTTPPSTTPPSTTPPVGEPTAFEPAAGHGSAAERRAAARLEAARTARERAERDRLRRRPGSPLLTAGTLGLALLLAGAVVAAGQVTDLPAATGTLALAAAVVVLGLGAVLAGLRGRRTALVGTGVPLALLAVAATVVPPAGGWRWQVDSVWRPGSGSAAGEGVSVPAGRLRVDPVDLRSTGATSVVTATLVAGRLEVLVPQGTTVLVRARALAGTVGWEDTGDVVVVGPDDSSTDDSGSDDSSPDDPSPDDPTAGGTGTRTVGGLDTDRVLAVGPAAQAVAEGTVVRGDDPADWTVPAGTAVLQAVTWTGEVRVGTSGSAVLGEG